MNYDQKNLAHRVRRLREAVGVTQEDVASELGIPRTAVVQIENGSRAVSSLELARMAAIFRCPLDDFFSEADPESETDPALVLFRLSDALGSDHQIQAKVRHCLSICRDGFELEQILERPGRDLPPDYSLDAPKSVMDAVQQGNRVAASERQRLGLGDAPVLDLAGLMNENGIWATSTELPDSMSGLFLADARLGLVILVNKGHCVARQRFSFAHEYGHALIDRQLKANVSVAENGTDLRETRANSFAAAFLMPEAGVRSLIRELNKGQPSKADTPVFDVAGNTWVENSLRPPANSQTISYQDVASLAHHFRVSYQAAAYRLNGLGIVTKTERAELLERESEAKDFMAFMQMFDPYAMAQDDRELVNQVLQLTIEAYRRCEVSRGRVMDIAANMGVSGRKLLTFAEPQS